MIKSNTILKGSFSIGHSEFSVQYPAFRNYKSERTSFDRGISLSNIPRHSCEQSDPMLRRCHCVSRRRINHKATVLSSRRQIHVINTYTSASNDLEPSTRRFKNLAANLLGN